MLYLFKRRIVMRITGGRGYVRFDLENGYIMKAEGEMLIDNTFLVYKDTMKSWEEPHNNEKVSDEQVENIIKMACKMMDKNTIQLIFE